MHYTQAHTLHELQTDGTSRAVQICFVVADTYAEVFTSDGVSQHDIVQFDGVKQDLNIDSGSFAVDELQFSIQGAAVQTALEKQVLSFILAATDVAVKRYVAIFLAEDGGNPVNLDNLLFIGTVEAESTATDAQWSGSEYSTNINPLRDWQFTALSFQMTILDDIDPYLDVLDVATPAELQSRNAFGELFPCYGSATTVQFHNGLGLGYAGIFTDQRTLPWSRLSGMNIWGAPISRTVRGSMVGVNLFNFLQALLKLAEPVIQARFGIAMTLNLKASATLLRGNVADYIVSTDSKKPMQIENIGTGLFGTNAAIREFDEFNVSAPSLSIKPMYVDFAMCYPDYANSANATFDNVPNSLPKFNPATQKHPFYTRRTENLEQIGEELSYRRFKSISALLFAIARALGAYPRFKLLSPTSLEISFEPRHSANTNGEIRLRDAVSGQLTTSPFASDEKKSDDNGQKKYVGQTSAYTLDSVDTAIVRKFTVEQPIFQLPKGIPQGWEQSTRMNNQPAGESLVHSTGWALVTAKSETVQPSYPQNTVFAVTLDTTTYSAGYALPLYRDALFTNPGMVVNTGIFVLIQDASNPLGQVLRPMGALTTKLNGEDVYFPNLAWYINWLEDRDGAFYKTEYQIEVPFLTGFSKNADGSLSSWKYVNLSQVLAPKIRLNDGYGDKIFSIVGVEWKLQTASVVLRLHNASRFAFAAPTANPSGDNTGIPTSGSGVIADPGQKEYELTPNIKVRKGDAVILWTFDFGGFISTTVVRFEPNAITASFGKYIGIALNDADGDATNPGDRRLSVQEVGIAELGDLAPGITLEAGERLYVRKFDPALYTNISNQILSVPDLNEHVMQFVGTVNTISPPTIKIDKTEVSSVFYDYYPF